VSLEVELTLGEDGGNVGLMIHSPNKDAGMIAFFGCTLGKYEGRIANGLTGIYLLPISNWSNPLHEERRVSKTCKRAPVTPGERVTLRFEYDKARNEYKLSMSRRGGDPVTMSVKATQWYKQKGPVALWLGDADVTLHRFAVDGALDSGWMRNEQRRLERK
jgi:hypothetical protein